MLKDESTSENRTAAGTVAGARMRELRMSTAELARRSGFAENTIRDLTQGTGSHNKSTWVAISAVLGFDPDYLFKILTGEADFSKGPHMTFQEDVIEIKIFIRKINKKIDAMTGSRHSSQDEVAR